MEGIRLYDLANLAIGSPEIGAVNFTAMHALLHAILKHFHIEDVSTELPGGTTRYLPSASILVKADEKGQVARMEHRILHIEKQLEALNTLPSGSDLIERSKSEQQGGSNAVEDMWQTMKLKRRLEVNEEGVCKAMTVLQDLMLEVTNLKKSHREVQDQIQKVTEIAGLENLSQVALKIETEKDVENLKKEMELLKTQLKNLEDKLEIVCETLGRHQETQAMTVLQDLMLEVNTLKKSHHEVQDQIQKVTESAKLENLSQVALKMETEKDIENLKKEMELLKTQLKSLEDKLEIFCETLGRHQETQAMTVLQDLMLEINTLKKSHREVQDQIQKVTEPAKLENLSQVALKMETEKDIENLKKEMELLKIQLKNLEDKSEIFFETLGRHQTTQDAQTSYCLEPSDNDSPMSGPSQVTEISISDGPILTTSQTTLQVTEISISDGPILTTQTMLPQIQGSSQAEDSAHPVDTPLVTQDGITASTLEDTKIEVLGQQHEMDLTYPEASIPQNTGINLCVTSTDAAVVPGSPEVTTAHPTGAMSMDHSILYTRVDALERDKADRTELGLLQRNTDALTQTVPEMQEKLTCLNKEMQDLRDDRLVQLQRAKDPIVTQHVDQRLEDSSKIHQQLGYLSAAIQDIEKELKELHDKQKQEKAIMEQSVADKSLQLQDQLDKLRGILTTMASSSSTLLAMSIPEQSDSCKPASTVTAETDLPAQATSTELPQSPVTTTASEEHLPCPACTIDIGKKVSKLVSQYEQLQKLVTDYTNGGAVGKDVQEGRKASDHCIKGTEVIGYIKSTMVQLQEECEQLNKTTKSLIQDHNQKQQHIDFLYQAVDKLESRKADKEMIGLEIDLKADKIAMERNASRIYFDATTEHLNRMIQDLIGKVNAQERDWQGLIKKINVEMQNKLDRIEIHSMKNILEDRWNDLHRQLQERPLQYETDEAAGIRKQLLTRFQCISCNRPVNLMAPAPEILTIPKIPGIQAHHSNRPHTVFELNNVRQQSRRLKSRIYQARCEASQLEMSINHLRRMHAQLCQEIARVQLHFGGSDKASRKTISHVVQAHCVTLGKFSKNYNSIQSLDNLPALDYYGRPKQKTIYIKFNTPYSSMQKDTTMAGFKDKVSVLDQDGRNYQGSKDHHLPTKKSKNGVLKFNLKSQEPQQHLPSIKGVPAPIYSKMTSQGRSVHLCCHLKVALHLRHDAQGHQDTTSSVLVLFNVS
ncbi:uncharacterized protein RB166_012072 [Leptodactylus fuscus]